MDIDDNYFIIINHNDGDYVIIRILYGTIRSNAQNVITSY